LCVDESRPTICCGMYYPSDARNAKGLEFLLYQLAFRIKRWIRWFQCWCGIRNIQEFNFSVFDYPNGENKENKKRIKEFENFVDDKRDDDVF